MHSDGICHTGFPDGLQATCQQTCMNGCVHSEKENNREMFKHYESFVYGYVSLHYTANSYNKTNQMH